MAGKMKLLVRMLAGKEIEVEVKKTGKMQDVKEYIYKTTGENIMDCVAQRIHLVAFVC